ncbi:hypothetical protein CASbig_80 [Mycobacterium phage CASbig]|uniref:hypothetical protein n=1 Tax=Mycobacterium phage CASbig TaxID=1327035 RepID=UPI00032B6705|nr:hypothetical protein JMN56_gp80 [Mycobacterium phage CASbig]AGK88119.1 hypothetical protein CASbig_80 [Mycobacterium phage CASbig]
MAYARSPCSLVYRPAGFMRANSSDTVTMVASLIGETERVSHAVPDSGLVPPSRCSFDVPTPTWPTSGRFTVVGMIVSPYEIGMFSPRRRTSELSWALSKMGPTISLGSRSEGTWARRPWWLLPAVLGASSFRVATGGSLLA